MYGDSLGDIEVQLITDGSTEPWSLKTVSGNKGYGWKQALVPIPTLSDSFSYQIFLKGDLHYTYYGDICIDDITLEDRDCSDELAPEDQGCDFENGFCSWVLGTRLEWSRASAETHYDEEGPGADHTIGDERGFYVYLDVPSEGSLARLNSPRMLNPTAEGTCMEFWYQQYGSPTGSRLIVYVQNMDGEISVWNETEPTGPQWGPGQVQLSGTDQFMVIFEGVRGSGYDGVLVLDDISFTTGACGTPSYCGFENGKCGFTQSLTDALPWQLSTPSSSSSDVLPPYDATYQLSKGHFMFLDLSNVQNVDYFGLLESGVFSQGTVTDRCLKVWFYMNNPPGVSLKVNQVGVPSGNTKILLSYSGMTLSTEWLAFQIPVSVDEDFKITFLGRSLDTTRDGSISIDDIKLNDGPCESPGTCNFENDYCLWKNVQDGDDFDWIRFRGEAGPSADPWGPYADHTKQTLAGVYAVMDTSGRSVGDSAILKSPEFLTDSIQCLEFYYYLHYETTGNLDVQVLSNTDTVPTTLISYNGNQGASWKQSLVTLNISDAESYTVLMKASVGDLSSEADINIDDIAFYSGNCTGRSDICHFTYDLCDWVQEDVYDEIDWLVGSGSDSRYGGVGGNLRDHSTGTADGGYAYIDMRDTQNQRGDRARLLSIERTPPIDGQAECLGFWYHLDEADVGSLNIYMQWMDNGTRFITDDPLWSTSGNRGDYWWFAGATFINKFPYQAVIEGLIGGANEGGITIDDVGFMPGPCDAKGHCSFDRDMCSWRNAADDELSEDEVPWTRESGIPFTTGIPPTNDHTSGTAEGYYMYVKWDSVNPWETATMYSEIFDPTTSGGDCFAFWYHAVGRYSSDVGLTVSYRKFNPPDTYEPVVMFSLTEGTIDRWFRGQFDIQSETEFQILFQVNGDGSSSDTAIDDTSITTSLCQEPNPWECSFEDGLCGYTQATDDEKDWTQRTGSTSSQLTGPSFDHTTGTSDGYYMYLETSSDSDGDKARLLSPFAPPNKYCIGFWFHMFGQTIRTLNVYLQRNETSLDLPVWTRTGSSGNQWIEAYVDVVDIYEFRVVYEAVKGSSFTGDIAIDDVDMVEGECTGTHTCDFQHDDICSYEQEPTRDDFDWLQGSGSTLSAGTGPTTDHTYGTTNGKYMYIDSSEQSPGDKAQLYTKIVSEDPSGIICWKFYYHMYGAGVDTLKILSDVDGVQSEVLSLSGNRGDKWFGAQAEVMKSERHRLVFEASVGDRTDTGDIAIDDVDFRSGACGHDLSCDFESDLCIWENAEYGDAADWIRLSGSSDTTETGPNVDHTIGTALGYYIYLESNTLAPGYVSWLISPSFRLEDLSVACFTFWYHMYGSTIGELNFFLVDETTLDETYQWRLNGQQNPDQDTWLQGKFGILNEGMTTPTPQLGQTYVIKIEAVLGYFNYGDIAIDDLDVESEACSVYPVSAEPSLQESVSCDFEVNRCGWFDMDDDRLDWTRYRGQTGNPNTGPFKDHTTGNGFYLYLESSQGALGYSAKVRSPVIPGTPIRACFSFWVYMYGQTMGQLELSVVSTDGEQQDSLWKQDGTLQNEWVYRQAQITTNYDFQLIFTATQGSSITSDIAIDDLSFDPSSGCPNLEECSFETDYCGWSQETVQDDFDWKRTRGKEHNAIPSDKTTGVNTGYYVWLDTTTNPVDGQNAILYSPTYTLTSIPHCLRFYYYHDGIGALTVHSRQSGTYSDPVWVAPPTGVTSWRFGSSTVTDVHSFQAAIKGTVGSTPGSLMAIDEVRIDIGACPPLGYCTFEEPTCDWSNVQNDDFDWLIYSGSTPSGGTGPTNDHTLGTTNGHYIYIESSSSGSEYQAILWSVDFPARIEGCFSFWYHMYGTDLGALNVYTQEMPSGIRRRIWSKEGNQGNVWILAEIDTSIGVYHQIFFQAIDHADTGSYTGDIALDDIQYSDHICKYVPPPTTAPTRPPVTITPLPWDCTFEGGTLCTWTQGTNNDIDWIIQTGSTPTVGTGPPADHTTQTKEGQYIVIDASSTNVDEVARLYSDAIPVGTQMCVTFWYHMYGAHVGTLNVGYGNTDGNEEGSVIWTKSGAQSYNWEVARVAIFTTITNPKVYLEGTAGDGYQGDIAIDDIIVVYGDCPALLFCDFQSDDACGFVDSDNDDMDWSRDRGLSSVSTGPQMDHTYGTTDGYYMRIKTGQRPQVGDYGRLLSPVYPTPLSGYRCVEFWYMMSDVFAEFSLEAAYLDENGYIIPSGIKMTYSDPTTGFWRRASLEVPSNYRNMFVFDLVVQDAIPGAFVAIDDVYMRNGQCISQLGSCDFEVDTCDWTNTQNADEIDWLRHSGSTGNQDTGPTFDHTTGTPSGWYMYLDSALGTYGTRARLESSSIDPPEDFACFSLWYHMTCSDDSKNTLTVAWETLDLTKVIWSFTGVEENEWSYRQLSFIVTDEYRMMIEGILADTADCDIAIDDLYLFNGACSADTTPAPPFSCLDGGGIVDASKVCDMRSDCADGSDETNCGICSFEDDECGYISDPVGMFPWVRQGGGVSTTPPPNLLLPSADYQGDSGTYMIVDNTATPVVGGDYARLVSPWIQEAGSSCVMQFWYYLSTADDIFVSYKTTPIEETIMYRTANTNGNWQQGIFAVGRIRNPFQINFLGSPGVSSSGSIITVSDVLLSNCGFLDTEVSCGVGEFTCSNRACVDMDRVCNYADDCGDYSDEMICDPDRYTGRCDFESNLCSYTHMPGDYLWIRTSGALTPETQYAPTRDHTSNSAGGHYLLADALITSPGDVARIASPTFRATGLTSNCQIRLYFFGHGTDTGVINIYTRTSVGGPLEFERKLSNFATDSFAYYDEDLTVLDSFQVVIEAVAGSGPNGAIAIDDISFMNCDLSNDPLPVGSTPVPPTTQIPCPIASDYQCGDGQCIPHDQVCDFITQCDNERDELYCGACEFDDSETCGSENFGWQMREAGSDSDYLPTDHFNNASAPGFYLESIYGYNTLTTPLVGPTGPACQVEFYYYMSMSSTQLELRVRVEDGQQLFVVRGSQNPGTWEYGVAYIGVFDEQIKLSFDHVYLFPIEGPSAFTMALDGISYLQCLGNSSVSPDISCTFEDGLCGYIQGLTPDEDDFDWMRARGETTSDHTGPRFDHTTGSGYYMYIEADGPADGKKAILKSHPQRTTSGDGVCLTWYYHMYGPDVDKFNVYIQQGSQATPIFKRQGTQGNQWKYAQWTVTSSISWGVAFEAYKGLGTSGDIAIDDVIVLDGACSSQRTCDFEVGFCSWTQDSSDDFDWTIGNNGSPSEGTGPPTDHTMGTDLGMFAYVHTAKPPRADGEVAKLFSPVYPASTSECLTFWYHVYGTSIGKLEILIYDTVSKESTSIWQQTGHEMQWYYGRASLTPSHPYQIDISATLGDAFNGDIAIDDLAILDEACSRPGFCDFEQDKCGWSDEQETDTRDWLRNNGATPSPFTGPSSDHTTGSQLGMYMYFEADGSLSNSWADLVSEYLPQTSASCVTFWYHMFGSDIGSLEVYTMGMDGTPIGPLWSKAGSQGDVWVLGGADMAFNGEFRVVFKASGTDGAEGDIALDDIDIQSGSCSDGGGPTAIPVVSMACTFESSMCAYTQLTSDQFDWTRTYWFTITGSTGPSIDHTRGDGNGWYVYIEASFQNPGDKAQLAAPTQNPTGAGSPKCLVFWYHMYGVQVNRLNVYLRRYKSQVTEDNIIFTKYGSQGNQWIKGEKEITTDETWAIIYEGVVGDGQYGDIALDDLNLYDGVCPQQAECDFELDFCFWTQDQSSSWKWLRNAGPTPTANTGPSYDHSTGTSFGYYAHVSASDASAGSKALLYSPIYLDTDLECLRFWYHMYGSNLGQLTVYTEDQVTLSNSDPLFTRTGPSSDSWRFGQVSISSSHRYKAVIEAMRGDGVQGDIAIDDVEVIRGSCPPPGFCDFQNDLCGWSQEVVEDQWDWLRTSGATDSSNTGPQVDHTYGTGEGFYIYFENSFLTSSTIGQSAALNSEHFDAVGSACLSFWYYMYGDYVGDLDVWMDFTSGKARKTLWSQIGEQGNSWINVKIDLNSDSEFRIQISAVGKIVGDEGDIAVDDLDIEMNGCSDIGTAPPVTTSKPTAAPVLSICTFETDWCDFTAFTTSSLSWARGYGSRSSYTGPTVDHTLGSTSGYYIYLDTSVGNSGDYARLLSMTMTSGSQGICLSWWYNMNGADINKLEVWKDVSSDIIEWVRLGHQGPDWKQGQVYLTGSFTADFRGYKGSGSRGEIALDDISFSTGMCPSQTMCDFEHGDWCGFDQDYTDQGDWNVEPNDFSSLALTYGPEVDHTYGTVLGHFIYVDSIISEALSKVRLISPVYPATFQRCLRLWAFINGSSPPEMTATVTIGNTPVTQILILSLNAGAVSNMWSVYEASLSSSLEYTIVFEATIYFEGILALDDINLNKDYCAPAGSCDFEYDTCTFWNDPSDDDLDWIRWNGPTPSPESGPDTDHSTGTPAGFYMYIDSAEPRQYGDKAVLFSPKVEGKKCLSFWYYMNGADGANLDVLTDVLVWTQSGSSYGSYWLHATVTTGEDYLSYAIRFRGSVGTPSQSDIAIDDISIYDGACAGVTDPPACQFYCDNGACLKDATMVCNFKDDCGDSSDEVNCGPCNFESSWCNYTDTSIGSMVWQRGKGATSTSNTGPSKDHTLGTSEGYYLYIDASQGSSYSEASLLSPELNEASPSCLLEVWVHMYGTDIGSLGIYIVSGLEAALLEWHEETSQDEWFRSSIGVGRIRGTFQIKFLAQRSFNVIGDIAIDDILFRDCGFADPPPDGCSSEDFTCANMRCIITDQVCDLTDDCGDLSDEVDCDTYERCSFEKGICSWNQVTTDELDWRHYSGITRTPWTGPARDHTTGLPAGFYIYLEASDGQPGDRARLVSRSITSMSSSGCFLRFYYHMYGEDINELNVYTRDTINGPLTRIWNRQGDLGDYYIRADIEIEDPTYPIQIIIEATRGAGIYGDIAIDDTSFTSGCVFSDTPLPSVTTVAPTPPPTLPACPQDSFQCNNGTCLDFEQRCDLNMDCGDGEDEINCGDCDFETDSCGWSSIPNGLYLWTRIQASDVPIGRGPDADHTKNLGSGYYMFVDSTYGTFAMTALLISPLVLGKAGSSCELEFYYHMLGGQVGSLSAIVYDNNLPDASWIMTGDQGSAWHRGSLLVGPRYAGQYYVRFEASPGLGFDDTSEPTDIAIDDIRFINCGSSADLNCDFGSASSEGTLCGWIQANGSDTFNWSLYKGRTPSGYTGPPYDHTDGLSYYAYMEASSPAKSGDIARLESGALRSTQNQPYCFSFWYHMYGPSVGTFHVIQRDADGQNEVIIWTKRGNQASVWLPGQKNIVTSSNYELVLEATRAANYYGDIGVDDTALTVGACPGSIDCDFELGFCDWTNLDTNIDDFDWLWGTPNSAQGKGPNVDHSTFTSTGHYVYVDTSVNSLGDTAILQSQDYIHTGPRCVSFYYHMSGSSPGSLSVYRQDDGDLLVSPSWTKGGDQGDRWMLAQVEIIPNPDKSYKIYIEATSSGLSTDSDLAIDDMNIDDRICLPEGDCTFEYDMCGYVNDYENDDNFDWIRGSITSSGYTGPSIDHTLQTGYGHYVFVEASQRIEGSRAWLLSEHFSPTAGRCMEFWYHMYGGGIGDLNVYTTTATTAPKLLFTKSRNQGDVWLQGKIDVESTTTFWVTFEAVVGYNYTSDIALDDMFLHPSICGIPIVIPTQGPPPTFAPDSHDCDFEAGLCTWTQDINNDFDWIWASGATDSAGTGPASDHTIGDQTGYYIYIETSTGSPDDVARLNSELLKNVDDTGYCMEFWYQMYGDHLGALTVYEKIGEVEVAVWLEQNPRGPQWNQVHLHFVDTGTYMVIFEGVHGPNTMGDIALDDISFHPGTCPTPSMCDFENGACYLSQTQPDQFDWEIIQANSESIAPAIDNTYRTEYGHIFFADMTGLSSNNDLAIVETGPLPPTSPLGQCFQFWYSMFNSGICQLQVYKIHVISGQTSLLWEMDGIAHEDEWHVMEMNLNNTDDLYKIRFQASTKDFNQNAAISLDDLSISTYPCSPFGDCNFETGLCTWKNEETTDDFDWQRIQGRTPSDGTGPGVDHTFGTAYGTYIYTEASNKTQGQAAILKSGDFTATEKRCVEFYYHMNGEGVGNLYVQSQADTATQVTTLKTLNGNKGDAWRQDMVSLDVINNAYSYQVMFQATVGSSHSSDISLDDITFYDGDCPDPPSDCDFLCGDSAETCIPYTEFCDFTPHCPNQMDELDCGSACTFEQDTCRWWNAGSSAYKWIRHQGATPDSNTGPAYDHTTLSAAGWYMYVGTTPSSGSAYAVLSSRMHNNAAATCEIRFWFHMYGEDIGTLYLYIQEESFLMLPWFKTGGQGDYWHEGIAGIGRIPGGFNVKFQSIRTFEVLGDIAIDDIRMESCALPVPQTQDCNSDEFRCDRDACITTRRLCDFTDDCGDSSDEAASICQDYDNCDFEDDTCDWSEDSLDDIDFQRIKGRSDSNSRTGPNGDHTTQYTGYYMVMDASTDGYNEGDSARLISQVYLSNGPECRFRLWYHMFGSNMGTLNIFMRTSIGGYMTTLFTKTGHSNDYWELADVDLPASGSPNFQVVIEAIRGDGPYGDIGIDDTSFTPDCVTTTGGLPSGTTTPAATTIGPCGAGKWQCADQTCIDSSQYCDYQQDCPDNSDEALCGPCQFDTSLCGWRDESFGQYAWAQEVGDIGTIPGLSVQADSGLYMRVLPGNGQFNEFARLTSPVLPDTSVECLFDFWYFYQTSSPTVEFKLEIKITDQAGYNLWIPSHSQSINWMNVQVGMGRRETTYQLLFAGFVESDSDIIAIDAISFTDCKVESYVPCEIQCDNQLCVPYTAICDYANDCGDGTDENSCSAYRMCNFESGTVCDWTQDSEDDLEWVWFNGYQGEVEGGPSDDHTYGNPSGHYFYLDSAEGDTNKKALLDGVVYSRPQNSGDCELRFWAFMNGANVNRLSVLTQVSTHDDPVRAWTQTWATGDVWIKYTVPMDTGYKFKVYFEGIAGGLDDSIALDDITMTPGCIKDPDQTLPESVTPTDSPHCDVGERACTDGTCIASEKFCNFIYDCDDVSDEIDCPSVCDFEDDLCMWTQGVNDNFDWSRFNNSEDATFAGPISDHSRGSPMGIYYFVDGLTSTRNHYASLISPKFGQAGTNCIASVWYYIYGTSYGNLEIKRRVGGVDRTLMTINEENAIASQWTQAKIALLPCLSNFNILIDAGNQQTTPTSGGYAIDDIRFDNCAFDVSPSSIPCQSNYYQCAAEHCYPRDDQCDFTKDCCTDSDNGNDEASCASYTQCDFESGLCDVWSLMAENDFDWSRVRGQDMNLLIFDHTLDSGDGSFMYMDPSDLASNGDITQLGSYIIQPTNANCQIRFYYYMSGISSGTLNVYTRTLVGGPLLSRWTDSGDRGLMWMKQVITLDSDDIFQVIIEGVKGEGSAGVLAIDDTTFTPDCRASVSSLPISTTQLPTTTTVPSTKARTEAPTTTTRAEKTTVNRVTPEASKETPESNTALIIGLSVSFGILFIVIGVISILYRCKGRRSKEDLASLRTDMETTGYDKDFGNMNFALQEVDTSMFGEYPSDTMPSAAGVDNPMYSSPPSLPIDEQTEA